MEQIILYEKLERNKNLVVQMYQKMKILETENNLKDEKINLLNKEYINVNKRLNIITQEKSEIKKELNLPIISG